jgi:hypothetical protein
MPLSPAEREKFTAQQQAHLDRMDVARLDGYLDPPDTEGVPKRTAKEREDSRAKLVDQWAAMGPNKLRMRVNCLSFGTPVTFAPESDYSAGEQGAIRWGWKSNIGRKADTDIPAILSHKAEMEADGLDPKIIKAILKAR